MAVKARAYIVALVYIIYSHAVISHKQIVQCDLAGKYVGILILGKR